MTRNLYRGLLPEFLSAIPVTVKLIIFTSILSIFAFIFGVFFPDSWRYLALTPGDVLSGRNLWTLITHMFLHANFFHLFVNMFSLFFVGLFVERIIGGKRMLKFYVISGILAGVFFVLSAYLGSLLGLERVLGGKDMAGVGASGALFGLLGILAVLVPNKRVFLLAGPIILIIIQYSFGQYIPSEFQMLFNVLINVLLFMTLFSLVYSSSLLKRLSIPVELPMWAAPLAAIVPLTILSFYVDLPISNMAHLGGLIAGLIYGGYLMFKYNRKLSMLRKYIK